MRDHLPNALKFLLVPMALLGLPFLGFLLSGKPLDPLWEIPPTTSTVIHASFSWPIFGIFSTIILGLVVALLILLFKGGKAHTTSKPLSPILRFPWWGWVSFGSLLLFWVLAWTRFPWFSDFQGLTFTPLWISFIFLLNALTYQRSGRCLILDHPRFFLSLLLWSALFWWYFEYLNRFVQNWRYVGLEPMTATFYVVHSTLAFSTVLPAVLSVCDLLYTFSIFTKCRYLNPLHISQPKKFSWILGSIGSSSLVGLAVWPNYLFPMLWIGPLFILLTFQILWSQSRVMSALNAGHWQVLTIPPCAGLFCGFFWELWNIYSAAQWEYAIPFVDRFHLFAMPILGYAGYLTFGLECVVAVDLLTNGRHRFAFMG
ncbi:hypothetical protein [Candidatus Nitronereus thalassa]|uniref:Mechanosensitive ion channel protein MscS n=1 Tax=Candidatus Nitronereus thalassa TaxID=3020898 RepID=A0ABU3K4W5_9BACT|nr:hypothetical protein [Candidatus Nitronereus thalassa]MDT7041447.1 hypothetical protein [Candidatus Nitronereus thalassa]